MPVQNTKSMITVEVVVPNVKGKAIVTKGDATFIVQAKGYSKGQELMIDLDSAVKMPSFLFALATLYDNNTKDAINFIKENF